LRNLLRDLFDGVQDFRRDSFANAEVFAFDSIDLQGAWKQSRMRPRLIASATPNHGWKAARFFVTGSHPLLQKQRGGRH
jgi:hypothetical protein